MRATTVCPGFSRPSFPAAVPPRGYSPRFPTGCPVGSRVAQPHNASPLVVCVVCSPVLSTIFPATARAASPHGTCTGRPRIASCVATSAGRRGALLVCVRCVFVIPPIDSKKGRETQSVRIILIVCSIRRVSAAAAAAAAAEPVTPNPSPPTPPYRRTRRLRTGAPKPPFAAESATELAAQLYTAVHSCRPTRVQQIFCSRDAPRQRQGRGAGRAKGGGWGGG